MGIDYSIIDKRYGRLTVVDLDHVTERGKTYWLCRCDCGNEIVVPRGNITNGHTSSCGCINRERGPMSMIGKRYGRLVVLEYSHRDRNGPYILCKCDCGNEKIVNADTVKAGHITSCGCKIRELRA